MVITQDDHVRISAAIDAVEQKTSGDIYCVVAHEASNYREVPIAWAAIVALVVPPAAMAVGVNATLLLKDIEGWSAVPVGALNHWLVIWSLLQAALFAGSALLFSLPTVRRLVTPPFLKRHR